MCSGTFIKVIKWHFIRGSKSVAYFWRVHNKSHDSEIRWLRSLRLLESSDSTTNSLQNLNDWKIKQHDQKTFSVALPLTPQQTKAISIHQHLSLLPSIITLSTPIQTTHKHIYRLEDKLIIIMRNKGFLLEINFHVNIREIIFWTLTSVFVEPRFIQ